MVLDGGGKMKLTAPIKRLESAICLNKRMIDFPEYSNTEVSVMKDEIAQFTRAIEILKDNEI